MLVNKVISYDVLEWPSEMLKYEKLVCTFIGSLIIYFI